MFDNGYASSGKSGCAFVGLMADVDLLRLTFLPTKRVRLKADCGRLSAGGIGQPVQRK